MDRRILRPHAVAMVAALVALGSALLRPVNAQAPARFELESGDTVVVIGNTFAERMAMSGYLSSLIHAAHPDLDLAVRQIPWSADEVGTRPREHSVPTMEDHLAEYRADVIFMCFGMSESFAGPEGLAAFENTLGAFIDALRAANFNGTSAPRLALISPIGHEDLGGHMVTGIELEGRNRDLRAYVDTMERVAGSKGVPFVDLFTPSAALYRTGTLTSNGIHPNELGCYAFARSIGEQLGWVGTASVEATPSADVLRRLAWDIHYHERLLYRATNTEYVWGRRHEPYGIVNFPPEMDQLRRMIAARIAAMNAIDDVKPEQLFATPPSGAAVWEEVPTSRDFPEDEWTPAPVEAKGRENSVGSLTILDPEEFKKAFTLPEGYEIDCFASEQTIPDLQSPLAMTFDARGRLWALCAPTYPHLLPGEQPRCRLVIVEDTDGDGRGDTSSIFADKLYIPSGFAIDTDAVYVGQAPDLLKLTDTDGDGVADRREIVASGFGMPDSHHTISAFEWEPNGGLMIHEGVFTKSNVETPFGTRRTHDAAVWRFDPRTQRLDLLSHCGFANPWGHAFDDYGQSVLADASGGANFSFSHVITAFDFPKKPKRVGHFINRGRPTAGCELISSRHFPEDVQGSFLVNQSIGFHGTRWSSMRIEGSGWGAAPMPKDLIDCSDVNFRPVAMEIGPDGALYVCDWCNPLIGHMQYNVRDPRRDHVHGRIWRVRHAERDLLTQPEIATTAAELLEQLRTIPERNTRQHARRRLQRMVATDVFPELISWMADLDAAGTLDDRLVLEALWLHQAHGRIDLEMLDRAATLDTPWARAGAIRVLRHWLQQGEVDPVAALPLLERAANDEDMGVRLEGAVACGFIPSAEAAAVAAAAAEHEMDEGLRIALEGTLAHLERYGEPDSAIVRRMRLERTSALELTDLPMDDDVAAVMLLRGDVLEETRHAALVHLAGNAPAEQASELLERLESARDPHAALLPLNDLVGRMSAGDLARAERRFRAAWMASADAATFERRPETHAAVTSLALAALVRLDDANIDEAAGDPAMLLAVAQLLEKAPQRLVRDLQAAVEAGRVPPGPAVAVIVDHAEDRDALAAWLAARVDAVDGWELSTVYRAHEVAMAALRALNTTKDLAPAADRYAITFDEQRWASGHDVYHDEITGCVRCHGVNGQGKEGFPPLDGSPWVLGNPERAATIVVHGLYGQIHSNDGRTFNSVMEPLGGPLSDAQIADVLSFVRQSWSNYAPAVTEEQVSVARASQPTEGVPVFADALMKRYPINATYVLPPVEVAGESTSRPMMTAPLYGFLIIGIGGVLLLGFIIDRFTSH
ncbi:MAG: PVC-type heme-binding CxxCH protein [Planctomycetota bacterium]